MNNEIQQTQQMSQVPQMQQAPQAQQFQQMSPQSPHPSHPGQQMQQVPQVQQGQQMLQSQQAQPVHYVQMVQPAPALFKDDERASKRGEGLRLACIILDAIGLCGVVVNLIFSVLGHVGAWTALPISYVLVMLAALISAACASKSWSLASAIFCLVESLASLGLAITFAVNKETQLYSIQPFVFFGVFFLFFVLHLCLQQQLYRRQ